MAINRAPFNALVDDDGSNTIGSPWNKAAIKDVILDPVDVALGALAGQWTDQPFNVANFWPGLLASHVVINRYAIVGSVMFWIIQIYQGTVPSPAGPYLPLVIPGGKALVAGNSCMGMAAGFDTGGGGNHVCNVFALSGGLGVAKLTGGNWIAGPMNLSYTVTLGVQ